MFRTTLKVALPITTLVLGFFVGACVGSNMEVADERSR
jgi:hypothetical protein